MRWAQLPPDRLMLTEHFSLDEALRSATAEAHGIANAPPLATLQNIIAAARCLEDMRAILGDNPVLVSSWYRCRQLNTLVGGVATSDHMTGWAVDFICPGFGTVGECFEHLAGSWLRFDQLIHEGTWIHVSFAPRGRQEVFAVRGER